MYNEIACHQITRSLAVQIETQESAHCEMFVRGCADADMAAPLLPFMWMLGLCQCSKIL